MDTLTSNELAALLGTDPRSCRRFLRRQFPGLVGQPGNWEVEVKNVEELVTTWQLLHPQLKPPTASVVHKKVMVEV